ncbi:lytic polysaccharide monooxygenase [Stigmatella sp. ncwal1]|uniref:Lytic polysaccharide monooxygenase n=1 Tax=Stigmatella ashevillensis TaxID=2995309 RepID=A0ABT5DN98_9BACT|nr:lytic polysaccharide monooxygenase [Stigmatella ashevillena]MDC0714519.1 lytic polysaccharide monooxygenase [Stigmatella ashevillena]
MLSKLAKTWLVLGLTLGVVSVGHSHGLIQEPPSRNWYCGVVTKPDEVGRPGEYAECADAFSSDPNGGYQFMSVLTHAQGRAVVTPLPPHVCGFGSETWSGGATPWDKSINWPTNNIRAGRQTITWNVTWGPHFDDTKEFRYWMTKPGFVYQVGKPLTWNDFEEAAFCVLTYDDSNPNGNPDISPDKANGLFRTSCNVPQRQGRHIIYGEWGRNHYTYERFHSCVDVVFSDSNGGTAQANISMQPNVTEFIGEGTLRLDGSASQGTGLSYQWSVNAPNPSLYKLENAGQSVATLSLTEPPAASNISISLRVSNSTSSHTATVSLKHLPRKSNGYVDLGPLTVQARTLNVGDKVSVRSVNSSGQDSYHPSTPLEITSATSVASAWPYALAEAVNQSSAALKIGVLDSAGGVVPQQHATANRLYALSAANIGNAYLQVESGNGNSTCKVSYTVTNQWNSGFQAELTITNLAATAINGWELSWTLGSNEQLTYGWSAAFTSSASSVVASNPASHWNGVLAANGGTAGIGFVGTKGSAPPAVPSVFMLNGTRCQQAATAVKHKHVH